MPIQVLLLKDVDALGRSGEIVNVKPGYARNFLLRGFAVVADKRALRMQASLKEAREKRAVEDKKESEKLAQQINGITLTKVVKVDHEGHMYGSVTTADIAHLLSDEVRAEIEKRYIALKHPIKATGIHNIPVKLKEGVTANFTLKVMSEEGFKTSSTE